MTIRNEIAVGTLMRALERKEIITFRIDNLTNGQYGVCVDCTYESRNPDLTNAVLDALGKSLAARAFHANERGE